MMYDGIRKRGKSIPARRGRCPNSTRIAPTRQATCRPRAWGVGTTLKMAHQRGAEPALVGSGASSGAPSGDGVGTRRHGGGRLAGTPR
jgi:hypothetical protein